MSTCELEIARNIEIREYEKAPIEKLTVLEGAAIGAFAFCGNKNIKEVYIKDKGTLIDTNAFSNSSVEKVDLSSDIKRINAFTFYSCLKLESIDLKNIEEIGDVAFYGCRNLKDVNLKNIKKIGRQAFSKSGIENLVVNAHLIEKDCFGQCHSLKKAKINTKSIPKYCFYECEKLSKAEIDEGVSFIDEYALSYLNLNSLFLPHSLCEVNESVFYSSSIKKIHYNGTEEQFYKIKNLKEAISCANKIDNIIFDKTLDELIQSGKTLSQINKIFNYRNNRDGGR